jgi:alcohol dehydrogenase
VAASICDIDRPLLTGTAPWEGSFAFGHEAGGEVLDIADTGTNLRPGGLVAVNWHIKCGKYDSC